MFRADGSENFTGKDVGSDSAWRCLLPFHSRDRAGQKLEICLLGEW